MKYEKRKADFGTTRYGPYTSPNPVILGKPYVKPEFGLGSYTYYNKDPGKDKPHALILSRKSPILGLVNPPFVNIFGYTRFGKSTSPSAVLRSWPFIKTLIDSNPGPGAYYTDPCEECKILPSMKGRWSEGYFCDPSPGPNRYILPPFIGKGPAYSLVPKRVDLSIQNSSPGPIYEILPERRKGFSLTFKPFPIGIKDEPGAGSYNTSDASNFVLPSFPATKFGKEYCPKCKWKEFQPENQSPGPNVNVSLSQRQGPNPPTAVLTSRRKFDYTGCGSGALVDLFNKTRFGPVGKSGAIMASRHEIKSKTQKEAEAETARYLQVMSRVQEPGYTPFANKKIGIKIKSRPKDVKTTDQLSPGPAGYYLPGMIGCGPAYSLGPKFRKTKERNNPSHPVIKQHNIEACRPSTCVEKTQVCDTLYELPKLPRRMEFPQNGDIFDLIPYLEQLCTKY